MNILGISCFYHDAAACLICDGHIVAAAQEERFDRKKCSQEFPLHAINYCLQTGGITIDSVDYIGFYEKPYLKFARYIIEHIRAWPWSLKHFFAATPTWLRDRLLLTLMCEEIIGFRGKVLFVKHHLAHAASSFLVSPFETAAILTADAVGEWATGTYGYGCATDIVILKEMRYPHSLGLLYTAITTFLGFEAHSGEGKVMGLAGYGEPAYLDMLKKIVQVCPDGSFFLDERWFGFNRGQRMFSKRFVNRFGAPRQQGEPLTERHYNIAASLQALVEDIVVKMSRHVYEVTQTDALCLSGGLFLNCVANSKILEQSPFKQVYIQPAAGDAGGALGVAAYIYHSLLNNPRVSSMTHAYWGPEYSHTEIQRILIHQKRVYRECDDAELISLVAKYIADGNIVGWFQGRMEYGPRALGNRSILADPRNPNIKEILNNRVKKRESFRPYAPVVLEEKKGEYFDIACESPFMLLSPRVHTNMRVRIPGVTHVDGTARIQTVSKATNQRLWMLL